MVKTYFGTPRLHQIALILSKFSVPPYHGSASLLLQGYLCACLVVLSLGILVHVYEGIFEEYRSDTYFDENKEGQIAIIVKRRLFMVTSHFVKKYLV